jgi:hypothetical protein
MNSNQTNSELYSKVIFYLSNDKIIDRNELFSLYRTGSKISLTEEQVDNLIDQAKAEIGFTETEFSKEKFIRDIHKEITDGIEVNKNYLKQKINEGRAIGLPKGEIIPSLTQVDELNRLIESNLVKKIQRKLKPTFAIIFCFLFAFLLFHFFTDTNDQIKNSQNFIMKETEKNVDSDLISSTLNPPIQVIEHEIPAEFYYEHKNIHESFPEIDQFYLSQCFDIFASFVSISNLYSIDNIISFSTPVPINDFYQEFVNKRDYLINTLGDEGFYNLSFEDMANNLKEETEKLYREERIFVIYTNILNGFKKIPSFPVPKGKYVNKISEILNHENQELNSILIKFLTGYELILNDVISNRKFSEEEIYDITESLNYFYILFCKQYYSCLWTYMNDLKNDFNCSEIGVLLLFFQEDWFDFIDSRVLETYFDIVSLNDYKSYLESMYILSDKYQKAEDSENEDIAYFKEVFSDIGDFKALSTLLMLEEISINFANHFTFFNYSRFIEYKKLTINELKYKEIAEIYKYNETILTKSSQIMELLLANNPNNLFLSKAVPNLKNINLNMLLLLRTVLFDFPLAFDSLYIRAKLQTTIRWWNDDEKKMMVIGAEYARLNQIILSLCATNVPVTMMNENDRFLKKQLSTAQYGELKRMSQIQPDWLEQPKISF